MPGSMLETPVAFFVFNRPDTTQRVFAAVAAARPSKLFLVADGPRIGRLGEADACRRVREIVSRVDWACEVFTNLSEENLGCQERVISGLNWVFSVVEEAIILEDDCVPDPSFFPFCQELLQRYRGDSRISYISGDNLILRYLKRPIEDSYYFSRLGGIWGWATWRSEWQRYDRDLSDWPQLKARKVLDEVFDDPRVVRFWTKIFDAMYEKTGPNTWDYQWVYTGLKNNSLTIVPAVNLVHNIGFGPDATHTTEVDLRATPGSNSIRFPLKHPSSFIPMSSCDRIRALNMLPPSKIHRAVRKALQTR